MKKTIFSKYFLVVLWLTVSTSNSFSCKQNEEEQPPAQVFEREVNERIEKYRKEDVVIRVIRNGQPVRNAMVDVKMLSHEFLFGSTRGFAAVSDNNNTLFAGLFNFATLPFYWKRYEPIQGKPDYAGSEQAAAWCRANDIRTKGHPLIYYHSEPSWLSGITTTTQQVHNLYMNRIETVTQRLKGIVDTWDVTNELIRATPAQSWFGAEHTRNFFAQPHDVIAREALAFARRGNPEAILMTNDNVVKYPSNNGANYEAFLDKLMDESGKPLFDAIGIQCHMIGYRPEWDGQSDIWTNQFIYEVCERFAKFGKPIHFTEMTVLSDKGEQWQAEEVVRIYTMLFSHPAVEAITWWDFTDLDSWTKAPAGLLHADDTPKLAYHALKQLIKETLATNITLKTDENGEVHLRAFRGKYSFDVTTPNDVKITPQYRTIQKGVPLIELNI